MYGVFSFAAGSLYGSRMAAHDSVAAKSRDRQAQQQIRILEANLAKTLMITEALWEIVRDKLKLTEEDLNEKLYQIDMRDGQLDGKNQRSVIECPNCQRKVSPRHPACIYCSQVIDDSVFHMQ